MKTLFLLLFAAANAQAELAATVSSVKTTGQKAVLMLGLTNRYPEKSGSAPGEARTLQERPIPPE